MNSIVFISNHHVINRIGGAEVQSDILASSLSDIGWDVVFVTNSVSKIQYFNNYKLVPAPVRKNKFKDLLSEINADIYYQRGRQEFTEWVGEFCKEVGKKFVFATSMDIDCVKHKYFFRNTKTIGDAIRQGVNSFRNIKLDKNSLSGMKKADIVLSQTYHQKKILRENIGLESKVFYNVHDVPDNINTNEKGKTPVILWLANIKTWKQPEIFLQLAKDMKETNCRFLMAGGLQSTKYKKLIKDTQKNHSNFEYLGPVSFQESNSLIATADIFVNTSKVQEGFPNTFIQAWLRGVPTVSLLFDPDELIVKQNLGIVCNNNYTKLKESISLLIHNNELRKEYSEKARNFSVNNFNLKKEITTFIQLLHG